MSAAGLGTLFLMPGRETMDKLYEIPLGWEEHLDVGKWVEILEAYGEATGREPIRVASMRVGGKTVISDKPRRWRKKGTALRPHEGEITSLNCGPEAASFGLRLGR
jgi:hypothetical protein